MQTPGDDGSSAHASPADRSPDDVVAEDDELDLPEPNARVLGTLFVLFLSGGAVDITMKTFQETFGADNSRFLFLLLAFGIAFLIGLAIVLRNGLRTGRWPDRRTWAWGAVLGVINYGSLEFLLRALEQLAGTVVFPVNNISIVVLAALLGVAFWGERLSRTNLAGLALAVLGLVLLSDLSLF
jgi:drug/metabolite transporter (DMT)-like permease